MPAPILHATATGFFERGTICATCVRGSTQIVPYEQHCGMRCALASYSNHFGHTVGVYCPPSAVLFAFNRLLQKTPFCRERSERDHFCLGQQLIICASAFDHMLRLPGAEGPPEGSKPDGSRLRRAFSFVRRHSSQGCGSVFTRGPRCPLPPRPRRARTVRSPPFPSLASPIIDLHLRSSRYNDGCVCPGSAM